MMRGEIFAYPLFLQKELSGSRNIQFMCTDVICKFWPYLTKVALHCPELATLLDMKPLLSVMHAKAHRLKYETTSKIQEETQTLEKFKSDLGVGDETGTTGQRKFSNGLIQRKQMRTWIVPRYYREQLKSCFLASNKGNRTSTVRQMDARKILEEKAKLTAAIEEYNTLVPDSAITSADEILSADLHAWPWALHGQTDLLTKKIAFDRVMLLSRLKEEELIVLKEVKQHWESLKRESENVQDFASHVALDLSRKSWKLNQSEAGSRGLFSMLQRRVSSLRRHQDTVNLIYSKAMGQDTSLLENNFIDDLLEEDLDDIYDSIHYSSDDEESITD
ncbi:uncharacterized protein LOC120047975 [Salvelinus namaycush]|uniref:Uncharacterized protein LOC120047975 n=1 Tax=Salvelinus namaycush TaxID=8040 RepID=A0A8U0UF46_SALNM|nr:uncharacterized protein LOC120047975 [Salvelinus namaycush]